VTTSSPCPPEVRVRRCGRAVKRPPAAEFRWG
jgi:hypothetical protein